MDRFKDPMEVNKRFSDDSMLINPAFFESLVETATKYKTLTNYLFGKAELNRENKLSIYINVSDILYALEPDSAAWKESALKGDLFPNIEPIEDEKNE